MSRLARYTAGGNTSSKNNKFYQINHSQKKQQKNSGKIAWLLLIKEITYLLTNALCKA